MVRRRGEGGAGGGRAEGGGAGPCPGLTRGAHLLAPLRAPPAFGRSFSRGVRHEGLAGSPFLRALSRQRGAARRRPREWPLPGTVPSGGRSRPAQRGARRRERGVLRQLGLAGCVPHTGLGSGPAGAGNLALALTPAPETVPSPGSPVTQIPQSSCWKVPSVSAGTPRGQALLVWTLKPDRWHQNHVSTLPAGTLGPTYHLSKPHFPHL